MTHISTEHNQQSQFAAPQALRLEDCEKTAGEKIHNEITYRGVDWIANTAFAVAFAYWANRTHMGQNWFSKPVQSGFEAIFRPMANSPEQLQTMASHGSTFASIMVGGTAIIPPMILLDKQKRPMVEWIDRKVYGDKEVDENQRFALRYEALENAPKKDFTAGMAARLGVLTPMLWGHVKYNESMNKWLYQPIAGMSKGGLRKLGVQPKEMMNKKFHGPEDVTDWEFLNTTFGMDVSLTLIYSYVHEWAYKGLASLRHGGKAEAAAAATTPDMSDKHADHSSKQPAAQIDAHSAHAQQRLEQTSEKAIAHG